MTNPPPDTPDPEADADAARQDESDGGCLSEQLTKAIEDAGEAPGEGLTLGDVLEHLRGRGAPMLLFVITSPFVLPTPTMGLSAPAGLVAACVGLSITLGRDPWLPSFVLRRRLSAGIGQRVVGATARVARQFERVLRPRLGFMLWPGPRSLIGVSLILSGLMLSLPMPIPGTNAVPAAAILLLCLALAERDGAMAIAGHTIVLVSLGVVWASWEATRAAITALFG